MISNLEFLHPAKQLLQSENKVTIFSDVQSFKQFYAQKPISCITERYSSPNQENKSRLRHKIQETWVQTNESLRKFSQWWWRHSSGPHWGGGLKLPQTVSQKMMIYYLICLDALRRDFYFWWESGDNNRESGSNNRCVEENTAKEKWITYQLKKKKKTMTNDQGKQCTINLTMINNINNVIII